MVDYARNPRLMPDYLAGLIMWGMIPATIALVGAVEAVQACWRKLRLNPRERRIVRLKSK